MSANNYILIKEKPSGTFEVLEKDFDGEGVISNVGIFRTLRSAVVRAEKHVNASEHGVEYGIRFSLGGRR